MSNVTILLICAQCFKTILVFLQHCYIKYYTFSWSGLFSLSFDIKFIMFIFMIAEYITIFWKSPKSPIHTAKLLSQVQDSNKLIFIYLLRNTQYKIIYTEAQAWVCELLQSSFGWPQSPGLHIFTTFLLNWYFTWNENQSTNQIRTWWNSSPKHTSWWAWCNWGSQMSDRSSCLP